MTKVTEEHINFIADLAMESEITDPIDWGLLNIDEETAYRMMSSHVVENFAKVPDENYVFVLYATITKLLVENFVANLKLQANSR